MVRGVNKQIVEINCTKDAYVEKAILIMNPQKGRLPQKVLDEKAEAYLQTILPPSKADREKTRLRFALFLLSGLAIALSIALLLVLL